MGERTLNALQAILIRERLILYMEDRKLRDSSFSVRKLIEAITFSEANAGKPSAYREDKDTGARYDSGYTLKNNTVSNLLSRKVSSMTEEHLRHLRDFLAHEGFLSPALLKLTARHPDPWLEPEFAGIATFDPRLQRHRYELEGEYLRGNPNEGMEQLWIAAPGRSKPFVTLRSSADCSNCKDRASLKCLSRDDGTYGSSSEGRIFLMPGKVLVLVEASYTEDDWNGDIRYVQHADDRFILTNTNKDVYSFERMSCATCATSIRSTYAVRDAGRASYVITREQMAGRLNIFETPNFRRDSAREHYKTPRPNQSYLDDALLKAASRGDAPAVLDAVLSGANPNSRESTSGRTAAHLAAAINSLSVIRTLTVDDASEQAVLREHHGARPFTDAAIAVWRRARCAYDPLIIDHNEQCYPSAFAPIVFDATPHSRDALEIWRTLMKLEMAERHTYEHYGKFAHLDYWQPSSVMTDAIFKHRP